jgi:type II secretory ATPase GspE/PulE/Tfp pilus assembly ATPase PilB-like protein
MEYQQEHRLLEQYALVANRKILSNLSDISADDRPLVGMLDWCRTHVHIIVLQSGCILSSRPSSRLVQNCKIVMQNKGIVPGVVYPATSELIQMLLADAGSDDDYQTSNESGVSTQQQRLRMLVKDALDLEASDIHIEVRPDIARIRFRKHGELFLQAEWPTHLAREVCSVAFNKETDHSITHFNPLVPQNASMPLAIEEQVVRLRLASLPAHGGFDVVMRILATASQKTMTLSELGYSDKHTALIKKAANMPHGAVIVAGPTGSGKTTTLASCLNMLGTDRKLYTIEDPVEKYIPQATQVPVNTEHYDRSFASMARTTLRMDPDVVMLGEMRDEDTAAVMVRAAITGHLVFSTVHTNGATDIVTRLADLGVSHSLLSSPNLLVCLVCQRLVPMLCQHCAVPVLQTATLAASIPRWREVFGADMTSLKTRGQSCACCQGLGVSGRSVVAEVVWVDDAGRGFISRGDVFGWQQYLKEQGWTTYEDQLLEKVRAGLCDPLDAEKLVGQISIQMGQERFDYRKEEATSGVSEIVRHA